MTDIDCHDEDSEPDVEPVKFDYVRFENEINWFVYCYPLLILVVYCSCNVQLIYKGSMSTGRMTTGY